MKCELCGEREASIHISKNSGFNQREQFLCEQCANESFSSQYSSFSDESFNIHQLLQSLSQHQKLTRRESETKRCATCGSTIESILKKGRFGCSECYTTFSDEALNIVNRVQLHQNSHVGRVPKKSRAHLEVKKQIETLKVKLSELVEAQNFEEAVVVRDEIKALESAGERCE
ncbi:UvrB/UvrC motif-containing protein [Corticicoccus populi]|uniref:UvrB/UvrC motif-containing protein n=1 Tax=Corticicoccus populi TaxID=1812821 RepID=A0ABW5WW46_9STAP